MTNSFIEIVYEFTFLLRIIHFQLFTFYDTNSNFQFMPLSAIIIRIRFVNSSYNSIWSICRSSRSSKDGSSKQCTCAARTRCLAHEGASLDMSTHHCVGCGLKIHSAALCGQSLLNLVANYPEFVGFQLAGGRKIVQDWPMPSLKTVFSTAVTYRNKMQKGIISSWKNYAENHVSI